MGIHAKAYNYYCEAVEVGGIRIWHVLVLSLESLDFVHLQLQLVRTGSTTCI